MIFQTEVAIMMSSHIWITCHCSCKVYRGWTDTEAKIHQHGLYRWLVAFGLLVKTWICEDTGMPHHIWDKIRGFVFFLWIPAHLPWECGTNSTILYENCFLTQVRSRKAVLVPTTHWKSNITGWISQIMTSHGIVVKLVLSQGIYC